MNDASWSPLPADVVLTDGGTVHVRAIEPTDGDRLLALHSRLSSESIYLRFFSPKPRLSPAEVERFTTVDHVEREALVALLGDQIVAVARYDRWPGRDEAEAAFVVDDAHHGRGITTILLEHLASLARYRGIRRFTAEVLPNNRAMLSVFAKVGFAIERSFAGGLIDVVLDLEGSDGMTDTIEARAQRSASRSIGRLLAARSVAVIGASNTPGTIGYSVFRNILAGRFDGPVFPVNPSVPHIGGVRTVPTVLDIADDVQLAVIAVPPEALRAVVEQCAQKRVRGVVVITEGISPDAAHSLVELARGNGMRLLGPSSMGLVRFSDASALHATFFAVVGQRGPVAISSQSGPLGLAMLQAAAQLHLGVSTFVSLGDRGDLSANDFLQFWQDDPSTALVLMYTESFGNPRRFGRVARRVSLHKPIVAVKVRTSEREAMVDALYAQAGVVRVDTVNELFDTGRVLASQPRPNGPRCAIVTNSASPAVLARAGFDLAGLVDAGVVNLTHRAGAQDFARAVAHELARPDVDSLVVVNAPPVLDEVEVMSAAIEQAAGAEPRKPVVAVTLGRRDGPLVTSGRVPNFAFPEPGVAALGRATAYESWRVRDHGHVPEVAGIDLDAVRTVVRDALGAHPGGTLLSLAAVDELLRAGGIAYAPAVGVAALDAATSAAGRLGYPVALKATGLVRPARSESSGVALDLQSQEELEGAYTRMVAALGSHAMSEAIVQGMAPGGVETRVTLEVDAVFGPVLGFGLGGAFADAIDDRNVRAVPVTDVDARELVDRSRAAAAIAEDTRAPIIDVILRLAAMADAVPELDRVDLNPVLVSADAAWVVGATAHVTPAEPAAPFPVRTA
ncbi:MAG: GNAT family N-acetyltransferase [Acidimicrobiales bacterium]